MGFGKFIFGFGAIAGVCYVAKEAKETVIQGITLSKEGSEEEQKTINKLKANSKAVSAGIVEGALDFFGGPRRFLTWPWWAFPVNPEKPKKSED